MTKLITILLVLSIMGCQSSRRTEQKMEIIVKLVLVENECVIPMKCALEE